MTAEKIDGRALALSIRRSLKLRVESLRPKLGRAPGLAVVLVGDDAASQIYVRNKERAAEKCGVGSRVCRLASTVSQSELLSCIHTLNNDPAIDGMIVQLPMPAHLDEASALVAVRPDKDADGLHPINLGRLAAGLPGPRPCTPLGAMRLLAESGVNCSGKRAVVVGRSAIVGKPMALLLLEANATVTVCHSQTTDLKWELAHADIVVAAVGRPELIRGGDLKPGCVVIDVGINRKGEYLCGDVDFASAESVASAITPVPGGVGPMTVAMLLSNTIDAAEASLYR